MAKKTNNVPKLLVIFDTNVLFTQVASDLVRNEIARIIDDNSKHTDLIIEWFLPDVVVGERKYQMMGRAKELIPNLQKLEKLLGHSFGVGEDTLDMYVDRAINTSIDKYKFHIAKVDTKEVDWGNLILRSINREPPFEASDKEKGFRDSIIAHSFLRLHKLSPSTPNICRLAFVSEDKLLRNYVEELIVGSKNVRILSSLDELESLINTLVSTIPEELATELTEKAAKLFFEKENTKSLYYKENVRGNIEEKYSEELNKKYIIGSTRSNGTWWISRPIFIKKIRQRIYWNTTIEPDFEMCHYENDESTRNGWSFLTDHLIEHDNKNRVPGLASLQGISSSPSPDPKQGLGLLGYALSNYPSKAQTVLGKKVVDIKGKEKFEVHWSATLSQSKYLTAPKIEKIQYLGNNLGE